MKCRDMLQSGRLEKQNLETAGRKSENRREKQIRGMENLLNRTSLRGMNWIFWRQSKKLNRTEHIRFII